MPLAPRRRRLALAAAAVAACAGRAVPDEPPAVAPGAAWELTVLGAPDPARLGLAARRPARLAIVGGDGISDARLALGPGDRFVHRRGADPGASTHDTQMLGVILAITRALGVSLEVRSWRAGPGLDDYASAFREAAAETPDAGSLRSPWEKPRAS